MKTILWFAVAVAGLAIMGWTYRNFIRLDDSANWSFGLIYLSDDEKAEMPDPAKFEHYPVTVRLLPSGPMGSALIQAMGNGSKSRQLSLTAELCEKVLLVDPKAIGIGEESLLSGRLPEPGRDEALAGYQTEGKRPHLDGRDFTVVGVLRRDVTAFAECYLVPPHDSVAPLFDPAKSSSYRASLVKLSNAEFKQREVQDQLKEIYPSDRFSAVASMVRAERGPYYLYLLGEGLLFLGGSLALIMLYRALAARATWSAFRDPLAELAGRPKLLGGLHIVYFGLVLAGSLLIYEMPEVQKAMLSSMKEAISDPNQPLGFAGEAYLSQNIPKAAVLTFVVNFFLGSLAVITVPSLIVPGSGILLAVFRAFIWGFALAPTLVGMSLVMIPHSVTLLLEGEGYILAAFFGLLVPIYFFDRSKGSGVPTRYWQSLLMNAKAMSLVAVVLAIAACYEAVEVILISK
jgi:hypothetical protein